MQNISKNLCSYMYEHYPDILKSIYGKVLFDNVICESEKITSISERCEWLANILPLVTLKELRDVMLR